MSQTALDTAGANAFGDGKLPEMRPPAPDVPKTVSGPEAEALSSADHSLGDIKMPPPGHKEASGEIPLVVSASEPLEQIIAGTKNLIHGLKLPEAESKAIVASLDEFLAAVEPSKGSHTLAELFGKMLLLSPQVQAIVKQHKDEASIYSAAPFQHTQINFAGMIYIFAELVTNDPALASALLAKDDHRPVDSRDLYAKLEAFYDELARKKGSAFGQLVCREIADSNSVGETAFLAGVITPSVALSHDIQRTIGEKIGAFFGGSVSQKLTDLGILLPLSRWDQSFLERMQSSATPEKPVEKSPNGVNPSLAKLVTVMLPQLEALEQKKAVMLEIFKLVQGMETCTDREVCLLMDRLPDEKKIILMNSLKTMTQTINSLPAHERIHKDGSWGAQSEDTLGVAIVIEAFRKLTPKTVLDVPNFERMLPRITAWLDKAASTYHKDYLAEMKYVCAQWYTKLLLQLNPKH